jgi:hypothetical protein
MPATATMRTAAAASRRSVYTSDSRWFRTAATASTPSLQALSLEVPNAASVQTMSRYGAKKSQSMPSFSKIAQYSTTAPVAAEIVEAATAAAADAPVEAAATQQWSELLFGGLLAVAFSATLVLGFPQSGQAAAAPATVQATSPATSSSSNKSSSSTGAPKVTFLPKPKSTKSNGGAAASSLMLSNLPLEAANSNNDSETRMVPLAFSNSGRAPYDVSFCCFQQLNWDTLSSVSLLLLFLRNECQIVSHVPLLSCSDFGPRHSWRPHDHGGSFLCRDGWKVRSRL